MSIAFSLRRVLVPQRLLLELFNGPGQCIAVRLNHPKLPADCKVISVSHDFSRQALVALVHSPSFEPTPDGAEIPLFDDPSYAELTLRYIDGDRIVEKRPSDPLPTNKQTIEELGQLMRGPSPLQPLTAFFASRQAGKSMVTAHASEPRGVDGKQPQTEAPGDWFRRIMSQPAE